jgi:RimJ/RimL family protein N-acetyltransferase
MAHGASSFLICETAAALRDRGMDVFNLGGADEHNPGLQRFKAGFDTASVDLQAIRLYLGSALKRRLTTAAALLRSDPRAFVGQLAGHWERYVVYAAAPADVVPADPIEGVSVEELSRESAAALPREDADVRRQMERFEALGFKGAYVVRCSGRVAHLAALVTAELDAHLPVRNVRLAPGEAEITHCLTLPDFRGQGIYPFAIRALCRVAAERGVHRVFMITAAANHASQHGIEKAGFRRRGTIVGVVLPFWPGGTRFTFRGHRWAGNG